MPILVRPWLSQRVIRYPPLPSGSVTSLPFLRLRRIVLATTRPRAGRHGLALAWAGGSAAGRASAGGLPERARRAAVAKRATENRRMGSRTVSRSGGRVSTMHTPLLAFGLCQDIYRVPTEAQRAHGRWRRRRGRRGASPHLLAGAAGRTIA